MLSQTKLNQTKWIFSHQLINQTKCIWFALLTDQHYTHCLSPFGYIRSIKSDFDAVKSKVGLLNK